MEKAHWKCPPYEGPRTRRIRKLISHNPKRAGSDSELRFSQYRDGMTVQEYIEACDRLKVPNYALSDIAWDLDHRFISLFD
jgi:hypothetical protein